MENGDVSIVEKGLWDRIRDWYRPEELNPELDYGDGYDEDE
jgi:hypothetical protein